MNHYWRAMSCEWVDNAHTLSPGRYFNNSFKFLPDHGIRHVSSVTVNPNSTCCSSSHNYPYSPVSLPRVNSLHCCQTCSSSEKNKLAGIPDSLKSVLMSLSVDCCLHPVSLLTRQFVNYLLYIATTIYISCLVEVLGQLIQIWRFQETNLAFNAPLQTYLENK